MAKPDTSIDPRIMDSAKEEFRTLGFEKASLKSICQRAGVTTGALYKRYAGKEELFRADVYKRQIRGVSLETLFKIAQVLKIQPSKLLEDD